MNKFIYKTPINLFDPDIVTLKQHIFEDERLPGMEYKENGVSFCKKVKLTNENHIEVPIAQVRAEKLNEKRLCKVCLLKYNTRKREDEE